MGTNTTGVDLVPDAAPSASFAAPVVAPNITLATVHSVTSATIVGLTVTKATPYVEKPQQFNNKDFKR